MSFGIDERERALLEGLRSALRTIEEGAPPALQALLPGIVELVRGEKATAFELAVEPDERVSLTRSATVGVAKGGALVARLRRVLRLHGRASAAWDPLHPPRRDRNRAVISVRALGRERYEALPVYRMAFRPAGLGDFDNLRAVLCDGSSVLAYVGVLRIAPFEDRQRDLLQALVPSLRARALLERRLGNGRFAQARIGALLDALAAPALIMSAHGRVLHANQAGRGVLMREVGLRDRLAAAIPRLDDPGFTIAKVQQRGARIEYLVVGRTVESAASLRGDVKHTAARAGLTRREAQILTALAQGLTNGGIAASLAISARTVESHLEAIYDKLGVSSRGAALALLLEATRSAPR
jgi:DNA-binding CsgD family transcriptional regulator